MHNSPPIMAYGPHLEPFQAAPADRGRGPSPAATPIRFAGEHGYIPLSLTFNATYLKDHWTVYEEGAATTGTVTDRNDWRVVRDIFVAETDEEAKDWVRNGNHAAHWVHENLPRARQSDWTQFLKHDPSVADEDVDIDYLVDNLWLVGSPETVTEKLLETQEVLGGFGTIIVNKYDYGDTPGCVPPLTRAVRHRGRAEREQGDRVMATRPRFADLPFSPDAPPNSSWGLYGPDDALGTLNLLTPERVLAAASCIRTGKRFTVGLPLDLPSPPFFGRQPLEHTVISLMPGMMDDKLDNYWPQGSTQWDAICHFGTEGTFYNGNSEDDVRAGPPRHPRRRAPGHRRPRRAPRRRVSRRAAPGHRSTPTRRSRSSPSCSMPPRPRRASSCARVTSSASAPAGSAGTSGSTPRARPPGGREPHPRRPALPRPQLPRGMAEYLWDHGVAAVAADNPTVEVMPPPPSPTGDPALTDPNATLHAQVMGKLGMTLGEFFVFDELADDCAADGVYEFFFAAAPINVTGGVGSPPSAVIVK